MLKSGENRKVQQILSIIGEWNDKHNGKHNWDTSQTLS